MKSFIGAQVALQATIKAAKLYADLVTDHDPDDGDHVVPGELRRFLARLRLLHGVPFSYLVPDAELLPPESIRFFYIDRAWTDALVQGVLSVGTITTADRAQLEAVYPHIRDEVDETERTIRAPPRRGPARRRRRHDHRLPAALARGVGLAQPARARLRGRRARRRRADHRGRVAPRPHEAAAHGAAGAGRAARAHRRRARGRAHRGAAPGHPVRRPARRRARRRRSAAPRCKVRDNAHRQPGAAGRRLHDRANSVDVPFRRGAPGVIDMAELRDRLAAKAPNVRRARWSRTSSPCRCCASRTARCSAIPTTPRAPSSTTSTASR